MTDTEASRIHERMDEIARDMGEVKVSVARMVATFELFQTRVVQLNAVVSGNGEEGHSVRLVRLEESRKYSSRWSAIMSNAVVGVTVGLIVGLGVAFFGK